MRINHILFSLIPIVIFSGCAHQQSDEVKPLIQRVNEREICGNLKRPEYLSFKQVAFSVAKQEGAEVNEIMDFYFYDKKFKSQHYRAIPELKIDLESKHNVHIGTYNYAMNNKGVDIVAKETGDERLFIQLKDHTVKIAPGNYKAGELVGHLRKFIHMDIAPEFLNINVEILSHGNINALELLNMITRAIATVANYDYAIREGWLEIINSTAMLTVKDDFFEPYLEMLERKHIRFTRTNNTVVIRDSFEQFYMAKRFLRSLNASEDRFTFCVHTSGEDLYGTFTGNERIVLMGMGKVQLIDYGMVHEGKLKYKLKITGENDNGVEEYTVYSQGDTFSTQLNNQSIVKIKLY